MDKFVTTDVQLGEGQYGTVFKAMHVDANIKEDFAIKKANNNEDEDEKDQRTARNINVLRWEISVMRFMGPHRNIMPVIAYENDTKTQRYGYVMPCLRPLWDLDASTDLPPTVMPITVMRDLMSALEFIHSKHVAHCDINPGNVMLSHDGTAVLGDFGSARSVNDQGFIEADAWNKHGLNLNIWTELCLSPSCNTAASMASDECYLEYCMGVYKPGFVNSKACDVHAATMSALHPWLPKRDELYEREERMAYIRSTPTLFVHPKLAQLVYDHVMVCQAERFTAVRLRNELFSIET